MRFNNTIVPLTVLVIAACATPLAPHDRDPSLPLQTEDLTYELRESARGLEMDIPFTYTNETGETVYVVNCNGNAPPSLQKRVDGEWVRAWAPVVPLCLSAPIVIAAGETYTDTLRVRAGHRNSNTFPQFEVGGPGVYRLLWHRVVHDYDSDRQDFGDPLPVAERVSNSFRIE